MINTLGQVNSTYKKKKSIDFSCRAKDWPSSAKYKFLYKLRQLREIHRIDRDICLAETLTVPGRLACIFHWLWAIWPMMWRRNSTRKSQRFCCACQEVPFSLCAQKDKTKICYLNISWEFSLGFQEFHWLFILTKGTGILNKFIYLNIPWDSWANWLRDTTGIH